MSDNMFVKPERPFLLHYEDSNGDGGWSWLETEDELHAVIKEHKEHGLSICD